MGNVKKRKIINGLFIGFIVVLLLGFIASVILVKKASDDIKTIEKREYSSVDYTVTLTDDTTYTKEDEFSFAANLVKSIEFEFDYYNDYDNYDDYELSVEKVLYVKPGPIDEYSSTKYGVIEVETVESSNGVALGKNDLTVAIDYQQYTTKLNEYVTLNGYNNKSVGRLEIVVVASNEESEIVNKAIASVSLLEDSVEISITKNINNNTSTILGNNATNLKLLAVFILAILIIVGVVYYFYFKLSRMDEYDRNVYKIFKLNRSILVNGDLKNVDVSSLIGVSSFKELLKVQNNVSLPIMYSKENDGIKFIIKVGNSGYYYNLNKNK